MIRALHVAPSFARADGGPSEVIRGLIPALRESNVDARLLSTDKLVNASDDDVLSWDHAQIVPQRHLASWTYSSALLRPLRRAIELADIVHVHSVHTFPTSAALWMAAVQRKPVVLQPHGALDTYHLDQGRLKKTLYLKSVDRFGLSRVRAVAYSSTRERQQGELALPGFRSLDLPLGIDPALLEEPRPRSGSAPSLLFLGRIAEKKRLDLLLRALASPELGTFRPQLIVAGPIDQDLSFDTEDLARELGVRRQVRFVGQVDQEERRRLLSTAGIFVLPSDDESFGMAVAEAMAAACTVISSADVGIAPDAAAAGALVIADRTPDSIARQIHHLLSHPEVRSATGARGREYARARFTWPEIAGRLAADYEDLVDGGRA